MEELEIGHAEGRILSHNKLLELGGPKDGRKAFARNVRVPHVEAVQA